MANPLTRAGGRGGSHGDPSQPVTRPRPAVAGAPHPGDTEGRWRAAPSPGEAGTGTAAWYGDEPRAALRQGRRRGEAPLGG